ncbi:MAG TPA: accessory factor UbiK family protein [Gammaproteobacteria bacterium]
MNLDPKILDDLARRLYEAVPSGLRDAQKDLENNFRAVLQNVLGRLDLVTREEFDVQTEVLRRTREKLESINLRLVELEDAIKPPTEKVAKPKAKGNGKK